MSIDPRPSSTGPCWLFLVHQLPAEPSRTRVKFWRRLQAIGAVAIKNSVYVLPAGEETREDFEWIRGEIIAEGGEAIVFSGNATDDLGAQEIRATLLAVRQQDWHNLREECEARLAAVADAGEKSSEGLPELRRQLKGFRSRLAQLDRIDYLGAPGRGEALQALSRLEESIEGRRTLGRKAPARDLRDYRKRTWMTRPRPGVDRMSSAWLIRRFIDPEARFIFGERIPQEERVLPFDMFGVEFGHQGDRVTFETLVGEFGLEDPVLQRIGRLVHVLDLRLEASDNGEAATFGRLIAGMRVSLTDDLQLLEHGMALFEALYVADRQQI